jgi:hypothetical protein
VGVGCLEFGVPGDLEFDFGKTCEDEWAGGMLIQFG